MSNWEQGRLGGKRSKIKKDLERQPRLKGVNTSECACVYVCFNAKKSSFQHARGRWVQCWGREPSRLVGCAGQEEVEMCFGLPISVGTQGKSEKKKDGKMWEKIIWVGKTGEAKYPWLHEILMHWRDAAGSPRRDTRVHGEMGTMRNRHGQPRLCFQSTEKILLLHFYFDFFSTVLPSLAGLAIFSSKSGCLRVIKAAIIGTWKSRKTQRGGLGRTSETGSWTRKLDTAWCCGGGF